MTQAISYLSFCLEKDSVSISLSHFFFLSKLMANIRKFNNVQPVPQQFGIYSFRIIKTHILIIASGYTLHCTIHPKISAEFPGGDIFRQATDSYYTTKSFFFFLFFVEIRKTF